MDNGKEIITCSSRRSVKFNSGNILVGDYVEILETDQKEWAIEKIYERRNSLIRPKAANVDKIVILISSIPEPDFYLIDKMLISAMIMGIKAYIIVNKSDLDVVDIYEKAVRDYKEQTEEIILASTYSKHNIEKIEKILEGALCCLVGQSAVGKSSLINLLTGGEKFEIGGMSKKINRGKHTTRHLEIVKLRNSTYLIDTPGFSFLELEFDPKDLHLYYKEFRKVDEDCRFTRCQHLKEPDCKVLEAIEKGEISQDRYERYKMLYEELLTKWRKKYG